jgi:hypothetical protein
MKILVACEESQAVTIELRKLGHQAFSCDIEQCSGGHPEWHIKGDAETLLKIIRQFTTEDGDVYEINKWDMIIAFPPCTYLCVSGLHWNKRVAGRQAETDKALEFVKMFMNYDCPRIAIENPVGCISTKIKKPTQIIQPYNFGEDASKKTCLWLKGLPKLKNTSYYPPRIVNGKERWGNQTDSGQNKLPPSDTRSAERSKTYPGIAKAMAEQWSSYLTDK